MLRKSLPIYQESNYQECQYNAIIFRIPTTVIEGRICVLLSEVSYFIPGAFCLEYNGCPIQFVLTPNYEHSHPRRIEYQPGCVLVVTTKFKTVILESSSSETTPNQPYIVQAQDNAYEDVIRSQRDSRVNESLVSDTGVLPVSNNVAGYFPVSRQMSLTIKDKEEILAKFQEVIEQNNKTHDEIKKTHQRLALLDRKMGALLTQNYELHEFPIPRMFIIHPVDRHPANPASMFTTKYRLYFLCECGEHTESQSNNTNNKHVIHVALHDGYDITKPTEFYAKYGHYILFLLRALRFGLQVAGVSIPPIAQNRECNRVIGNVTAKTLDACITFLDAKLSDTISSRSSETTHGQLEVSGEENFQQLVALEGADLRQLRMFISDSDRYKVLGNLYRVITKTGHVKWVCLSHYRNKYWETAGTQLRNIIRVQGGDYDEHYGKVVLTLTSIILVEEFSEAIVHSKQLQELDVTFQYKWQSYDLRGIERVQ
ncbi:hypothetical protein K7432_014058 [Basidiobolus ranarum]|uniref:Uncharacterized protein n=1 Tax=Basidiobolus ranarum TaxID=34480 RepID=A0ABR2VQ40_9FUNG